MSATILILDDDPAVLATLAAVLEDMGTPLIRCSEPRKALEEVWEHRPSVVITDLMMPQMNGLEVLRRVKEIDPRIEVIVVTGYGSVKEAVDAIRDGAFDFICKPFNAALIEAVVGRALDSAKKAGVGLPPESLS